MVKLIVFSILSDLQNYPSLHVLWAATKLRGILHVLKLATSD